MERKKILIFSLAYPPDRTVVRAGLPVGGAEVAVKEITDRLPEYQFEIISADLRSFWSKYFYPLWAYRRASKQHRAKKYDLVWAIMANQAGMAGASFKRRFPAVPFLLTLQEGDDLNSFAYRLRLLAPRLWRVFQTPDQIQVISNYLGRWARKMGARCPITVIPNGVDLEKFKTQSEKLKTTTKNEKVIITTSRLVKKNGVDILIEALKFLPENIKLQILGTGEEKENLKQLMSRHRLDSRVEFLGQVPPSQVSSYLAQADVFVRASRSEGLGNSFLEAMAAELPTIGTPVGGIRDFLKEEETGWLCEVDNPKSLASKVQYILDPTNVKKVMEVKERAQKLVREGYDWNMIADRMGKLLSV